MAQSNKGPVSSVPASLQEASHLTSEVVDASQKTRRNQVAFHRLAQKALEFVGDMIDFYLIMEPYCPLGVPEDLAVVFQRIVNSLKDVREFMRRAASRNIFTAFIFSRSDVKGLRTYEMTLDMNQGSFKLIYNVCLKKLATQLSAETVKALMQKLGAAASVEE